jgi:hypothetical protein
VPVEFIGLARDLIRRVDRTDTKGGHLLAVRSLPLIGRKKRRQTLRSECLAEAARHWRTEMPAFGRRRKVRAATEQAATHTIEALAGGDAMTESPVDVETARAQQRRAQDRVDATNAARSEIERRQHLVDDQLRGIPHMVDAAIRDVIYAETRTQRDDLTQRVYTAQVAFIDAVWSLGLLMRLRPRPLSDDDREHDAAAMQDQVHPAHWRIPGIHTVPPVLARWRAWEAALQTDPMASVPEGNDTTVG